jgi:hypothetical protein
MKNEDREYGICGVYCGQCPNGNGRVKMIAGELKRLVDTVGYDWVESTVKSFSFSEFRKGLEWFSRAQCPMCLNHGGAPCENKKCASKTVREFQRGDYVFKELDVCQKCPDEKQMITGIYKEVKEKEKTYPF